MHLTFLSILATATLSFAQSSTISLFIPGTDTQSLVASIVGSDATATTYAIQCAPGTESDDCGFPEVVTLTEGPARAVYTFTPEVDNGTTAFAGYVDCSLAESSAVCTVSDGGSEANSAGIFTSTVTGTDYTFMPVVITAGVAVASTGSSVPASTTSSSSKSTGTNTSASGSKTSGSQTSSGAAAQTTSGSSSKTSGTSTSTAGGSVMTGSPAWVIGGAALALAALA